MKRSLVLVVYLILVSVKSFSQYDFFPLREDLKFVYKFQSIEKEYESLMLLQTTEDSGTVTFEILNQELLDSSRIWEIVERDSIYRRIIYWWSGLDTSYYINNTSTRTLTEKMDGFHELDLTSYYYVWDFPTRWYYDGSCCLYGDSVYRFKDDSLDYIINQSYYGVVSYKDSLHFKNKTGLIYAEATTAKGPNTPYFFHWEAFLLNPTIVNLDYEILRNPTSFILSQNFPNPFNPNTKIKYSVPQLSHIQIKVFDLLGNEIASFLEGEKPLGTYELTWNAGNIPSGVYFYQLRAGNYIETKKMILLK